MIKSVLAIALAMMIAGPSYAQGKIAVLDLQTAIIRTDAAQKELKDMRADAEYAALQAKGESLSSEMKALVEEMQTKGLTWSDERKAEQRKKMEFKQADLQLVSQKLKKEQAEVMQSLIRKHGAKANKYAEEVIKSGGYGLVLNAGAVQWADAAFDITSKVTDKLNKAK
ncbi:MAG: OmpH family outer membrane protein [Cellvibrionaceae bacterium]|nr:OmpH family outer membrane protein [Cellvibrionaceae bacterium]MCV6625495.1 OmpH family outer membrane protein [Cellvibrionaceae bacterium]